MGVWGGPGAPEACTYPHGTRASGPLSEQRVKWPSRKWRKVGLGTARRKPERPGTRGRQSDFLKQVRPSVLAAQSAAGAGALPRPRRVTPQPPSRPGDLPQQSLPWVLAQGSPSTASRSRLLTKKPFPLRAARHIANFLRKTFQDGARPWAAQARARGPGQGAASARGTRAEDDPELCLARHCSLCLPLLQRRDTSADLDAGGLVT